MRRKRNQTRVDKLAGKEEGMNCEELIKTEDSLQKGLTLKFSISEKTCY